MTLEGLSDALLEEPIFQLLQQEIDFGSVWFAFGKADFGQFRMMLGGIAFCKSMTKLTS